MMNTLTLRRKIQVLVISIIALISMFIVLYVPRQQQSLLRTEFHQKVESLAETVRLGISIGLSSGDMSSIQKVLDFAKNDPSVRFVAILSDGATFAAQPKGFQFSKELASVDTLVIAKRPFESDALKGEIAVGCSTSAINAQIAEVRLQAVFIALGMMLLGIVAAWFLAKTIVKPIKALSNAAQKVGEGDLTQTVRVQTNDEVGVLSTAFNAMVEKIRDSMRIANDNREQAEEQAARVQTIMNQVSEQREYLAESIQTMLKSVEQLAKGDLTQNVQAEKNDDIGRLFEGYNAAVENMRGLVAQVVEAVEATNESSANIYLVTEQTMNDIREQSSQTRNVAAAMEEMTVVIGENTRHASLAAHQAAQASDDARRSGSVIQGMIKNVGEVSSVVKESAARIEALGRSSEQIGEIVSVIEEIADQTNLLALNAAIEAARAGEQGRGFAVVADEVRKLAERTQKATKEIGTMIRSIQSNTTEVVSTMNKGTKLVEESGSLAGQTSEALNEIISKTMQVSDIVSQLASASEEQAATSNDVAQSIESISNSAERSANAAASISQIAANLSFLTQDLQKLVGTFRVGVQALGQKFIQGKPQKQLRAS
ncbi:MAG: methyl-accepting chemotaxis protein [Candidatus Kapabacteria bacterium]|jgi:methyl-accepting chemotaxis protein|nr:methyl-accepting chemotaxis protein [Candidatus Kapabacteria bacterium]